MDNRINEIRRKISALRSEMIDLEGSIRDQVNRDLDCGASSLHLIGLRHEMARLIREWKAVGGGEPLPNVREPGGKRPSKPGGSLAPAGVRR